MTFEEARQLISDSVGSMTTTLFTSDRIVYPNKPNPDLSDLPQIPFMQVDLDYNVTRQMALGVNPPARNFGNLTLTYFVAMNSGSKAQSEFIDLVVSNFQLKTIGGIVFKETSPNKPVKGLDWTFISVSTPFYFDTIT